MKKVTRFEVVPVAEVVRIAAPVEKKPPEPLPNAGVLLAQRPRRRRSIARLKGGK